MIPTNTLWAIDERRFAAMNARLPALAEWPGPEKLAEAQQAAVQRLGKVSGKVAVVPIRGVIEQRMSMYGYFFGSAPTEDIGRTLDALMARKDVSAVVLDFDSPGGTIAGVQELASKVYGYRGNGKPVYAISNSMMCSAAYWIGSAASAVYSTPGGENGSIGVFMAHADESKFLEGMGIKVTVIKAGRYKAEGASWEPLTAEAVQFYQQSVDASYADFVADVARFRGKAPSEVRKGFGEGRSYWASMALESGMIDRVLSLDELLAKLGGESGGDGGKRTSAAALLLRHELAKARA